MNNNEYMRKTIFCDIDGTLLKHISHQKMNENNDIYNQDMLINTTLEKLMEWERKGYMIILTTGRRESLRKITEKQLLNFGIVYDLLIMGLGRGDRIIINDRKPDSDIPTAYAYSFPRNYGIGDINI